MPIRERRKYAKLTVEKIAEIINALAYTDKSMAVIAAELGVSPATVGKINCRHNHPGHDPLEEHEQSD